MQEYKTFGHKRLISCLTNGIGITADQRRMLKKEGVLHKKGWKHEAALLEVTDDWVQMFNSAGNSSRPDSSEGRVKRLEKQVRELTKNHMELDDQMQRLKEKYIEVLEKLN